MNQALKAMEEWSVSAAVKRERISESLRSPAANVIQSLRRGKPDCVAMDYIKTLCAVYGRVEKLPDLMFKFEHTHQSRGERLS